MGAGACRSILLSSVAVALLLSQVSALPSMLPSCCALCDANLKLCQLERWRADDEAAQFLSVGVLAEPMLDFAFNAPVPSTAPLDEGGGATWRRAQRQTRIRFSPDFVGEMGLERQIHEQTFLSPSMENARSGIARVWSVPVASLRGAAETQPRPKPNPNFLTVTPTPTPTLSLSLSDLHPGPNRCDSELGACDGA